MGKDHRHGGRSLSRGTQPPKSPARLAAEAASVEKRKKADDKAANTAQAMKKLKKKS